MTARLSERLSSLISVFLLLGLAAGTYYLAEKSSQFADPAARPPLASEPDSFVDGLSLTKVNARGDPVFRLFAKRMVHYPVDNRTEYDAPFLVSLDTDRPKLTIQARHARANAGGDVTELTEDVVLIREAGQFGGKTEPRVRITTQAMTLLSEEEIARTGEPVKIEYASSVLTGVGMEFNQATRQFTLNGDVKGSYISQKK